MSNSRVVISKFIFPRSRESIQLLAENAYIYMFTSYLLSTHLFTLVNTEYK